MSEDLKTRIEARIKYWTNELQDLPEEFSQANYDRMKWIRETLDGLHETKAKFCRVAKPEAQRTRAELEMEALLY